MSSPSNITLLCSQKMVQKFKGKAKNIKKMMSNDPRASHPQVSDIVETLLQFYADAEAMAQKMSNPTMRAVFKEEQELAAELENALIRYVIVEGPHKAKVEKLSTRYI